MQASYLLHLVIEISATIVVGLGLGLGLDKRIIFYMSEKLGNKRSYVYFLVGNILFFVYISILSNYLSSEVLSKFRYWINACALVSQLMIFGLDVYIIKTAGVKDSKIYLNKGLIFSLIAPLFLVLLISAILVMIIYDFYIGSLMLMSCLWMISNIVISVQKVTIGVVDSHFNSVIVQRIFRLISVAPVLFGVLDIYSNIFSVLLFQVGFILFLMNPVFRPFADGRALFKSEKFNLIDILRSYLSVISILVLLRIDVVMAKIFDVVSDYYILDYVFIVLIVFHVIYQTSQRNIEQYFILNSGNKFKLNGYNASYLGLGIFCFSMLSFVMSPLIGIDKLEGKNFALILLIISYGYYIFACFGPVIEAGNFVKSESMPIAILIISILLSVIFVKGVGFNDDLLSCAVAISLTFALFRFIHIILYRAMYSFDCKFIFQLFFFNILYVSMLIVFWHNPNGYL